MCGRAGASRFGRKKKINNLSTLSTRLLSPSPWPQSLSVALRPARPRWSRSERKLRFGGVDVPPSSIYSRLSSCAHPTPRP